MKHHRYNSDFPFVEQPIDFTKHTEKTMLQYCLGAALYMPAIRDFFSIIVDGKIRGLTTMVMCFEDAIKEEDVPQAEVNALRLLDKLSEAKKAGALREEDIPLIFFRVRSPEQFESFSAKLQDNHVKLFAGFVFPKFAIVNGSAYFEHLRLLNLRFNEILYGMPILESSHIAYKESRTVELAGIRQIVERYKDLVLNVRVGATDFSSCFGVRRGIDYTIYDILTVRDCLLDILNTFTRNNDYVVSGPVWEYFLVNDGMKFSDISADKIHRSLITRDPVINDAVDGLLREVILDKANGFIGKTIIHPTHLKYVNAMQCVTAEEYHDALQILDTAGGVVKSERANKMNEIKPHTSWAKKVLARAKSYGVIEDETCYIKLFS